MALPGTEYRANLNEIISQSGQNEFSWILNNDMNFLLIPSRIMVPSHIEVVRTHMEKYFDVIGDTWMENRTVEIGYNISLEIFKEVLRFMYTAYLQLSNNNAVLLMHASHHLQIAALEKLCIDFLLKELTIYNVCHFYQQSYCIINRYTERCKHLIQTNASVLLQRHNLIEMDLKPLSIILKMPLNINSDVEIFAAMLKYAERICASRNIPSTPNNKHEALQGRLVHVKFNTMCLKELVQCHGLDVNFFSPSEIYDMLQVCIGQTHENHYRNPEQAVYSRQRRPKLIDTYLESRLLMYAEIRSFEFDADDVFRLRALVPVLVFGFRVFGSGVEETENSILFKLTRGDRPFDIKPPQYESLTNTYKVLLSDPMELHPGATYYFQMRIRNSTNENPCWCKCIDLSRMRLSRSDEVFFEFDEHLPNRYIRVLDVLYKVII